MSKTGQAAEKDEQQQSRGIALMQGICAVVYRKADNTPCPIKQVWTTALSFALSLTI
jgi:hypothetical protein